MLRDFLDFPLGFVQLPLVRDQNRYHSPREGYATKDVKRGSATDACSGQPAADDRSQNAAEAAHASAPSDTSGLGISGVAVGQRLAAG